MNEKSNIELSGTIRFKLYLDPPCFIIERFNFEWECYDEVIKLNEEQTKTFIEMFKR